MFAASLEQLLGESFAAVSTETDDATRKAIRRGAKLLRGKYTEGVGVHDWSAEFRSGFASHMNRSGAYAEGEIGNKTKPGLVHLLEKGHLTINGQRSTRAFPHMAPAFEDISEDFINRVRTAVGEGLAK